MKYKLLLFALLNLFSAALYAGNTGFDRANFYAAIASEKLDLIEAQINTVKASSLPEKLAYEGALLMKKSGLIKGPPKEKLSTFKDGRAKLEAAIAKDKDNIEYRFLRLIIQENAPKIVKYKSEIDEDSLLVRTSYRSLPDFLQKFIADYARQSKVLKLS